MFDFKILNQPNSADTARLGRITTATGMITTPAYMPVATRAVVKTLSMQDLSSLEYDLILSNAYHLYLRPGLDVIKAAGGLHNFMNWNRSILTDSGGYQVFSLGSNVSVDDDGVEFKSVYDGSAHRFTPESVINMQCVFGSDIIMPLDVCSSPGTGAQELDVARQRTREWAARSKRAFMESCGAKEALFGIIQGGTDLELRKQACEEIIAIGFDGYALGGLSVGEPHNTMLEVVKACDRLLPPEKPRYLMGLGNPTSLIKAVSLGIDMFDSVLPTRIARNGTVYVAHGRVNIKKAEFAKDFAPLEEGCPCEACKNHSRAYLRHLFINREILAMRLLTIHNLTFMKRFFDNIRDSLEKGCFPEFKELFLSEFHEDIN